MLMPPDSDIDPVSIPYDLLTPAQVERLRTDADRILDDIGLEVRDHPGAARSFMQRARNPVHDVLLGNGFRERGTTWTR